MLIYKILYHVNAILKKCFFKVIYQNKVKFGKNVTFRSRFNIAIEDDGKIEIGKNCFFNNDCSITSRQKVIIGENTIFGENVKIYDNNHIFNNEDVAIKEQGYKSEIVKIGKNCWIASNVTILKGCKIGDNCVISAGCVIDKKIESNRIVKMKKDLAVEDIIYKKGINSKSNGKA